MSQLHERSGPLAALEAAMPQGHVSTDPAELDRRSHDCWPLQTKLARLGRHEHRPAAVVAVTTEQEVADVLRIAGAQGVAVTPWGLGSAVTGAPLATSGGVMLDLSGLRDGFALDEEDLSVTVGAGARGLDVEQRVNERGYTLGHYPQSLDRSTVGGWLATRASGQQSSRYGGIEDLVVGFAAVLADGRRVRFGAAPRAAMGPDLRQLFLGSEGTLAVVTEATLKVFPLPTHRRLEAFRLPSVEAGVDAMRRIVREGLRPSLVRFYDEDESRHAVRDDDFAGCAMFCATEGLQPVADAEHGELARIVAEAGGSSLGPAPVHAWLERRFDFSSIERVLERSGGYAETIEVAQRWSGILPLYRALKSSLAPLADEVLGHFSHVYPQGTSLYVILRGQATDDEAAVARLRAIWTTAMDVTLRHGGELSHHHGAGLARLPYMEAALGERLEILRAIKQALDPQGTLNPGKLGL